MVCHLTLSKNAPVQLHVYNTSVPNTYSITLRLKGGTGTVTGIAMNIVEATDLLVLLVFFFF